MMEMLSGLKRHLPTELLKYYDGDSSISASLFSDRTFPFWAFLVLAAFILLFALLRLHAATLTFSILNLL